MKKTILYFVISTLIGLAVGYLVFDVLVGKDDQTIATVESVKKTTETSKTTNSTKESPKEATTTSAETEIFTQKGCIGCHSISALDLSGGSTGPDLSQAFNNVEGKHGKPINEFLKQPTSAVMSGVIGGHPLTDAEITKITTLLQQAAAQSK